MSLGFDCGLSPRLTKTPGVVIAVEPPHRQPKPWPLADGALNVLVRIGSPTMGLTKEVSSLEDSIATAEFDRFFYEARSRLVGQAYVLCGNLQDAQDLSQETLIRVWRNWARVRELNDPVGWARQETLILG